MPVIPSTTFHQLHNAIKQVGQDETLRQSFVDCIKGIEQKISSSPKLNVREEITGPIMDALFEGTSSLSKTLHNGLQLSFLYRSKIARDFLLSSPVNPDHVFEPQTTRLVNYFAALGGDVLIGGAYFGDHAILAANTIRHSHYRVHAFEPSPEQHASLLTNKTHNGLDNIQAIMKGLWNQDNTRLQLVGDDAYAYAIEMQPENPPTEGTFCFDATSINAYGQENKIHHLGTLLLDIEGSELMVFKGASNYLKEGHELAPNIIFEVHRQFVNWSKGLKNTDVVKHLYQMGYSHIYALRDFQSNIDMSDCKIELVPLDDIYLDGPAHGFNMIAVKDLQTITTDLFRITPGVSPKLLIHKDPALHFPSEWLNNTASINRE